MAKVKERMELIHTETNQKLDSSSAKTTALITSNVRSSIDQTNAAQRRLMNDELKQGLKQNISASFLKYSSLEQMLEETNRQLEATTQIVKDNKEKDQN